MPRAGQVIEKFIEIVQANGAVGSGVRLLIGTGAPGGDGDEQDDANVGSIFLRTDGAGGIYKKDKDNDEQEDWQLIDIASVQETGVTTTEVIDFVLVDSVKAAFWIVHAFEEVAPTKVVSMLVFAMHNGTDANDASEVDDTVFAKLKLGANFDLEIEVGLALSGISQEMQLKATSSTAGVTVSARRIEVS